MTSLGAWGLDDVDELVYRAVLRHPGRSRDEVSGLIGRGYVEVLTAVRSLIRLGLVQARGTALVAKPPGEAFAELLAAARDELAERERQLVALRDSMTEFVVDYGRATLDARTASPVEIVAGLEAVNAVLGELSGHMTGELLTCIRPPLRPPPPGSPGRGRSFSEPSYAAGRPARTVYRSDLLDDPDWWRAVREMAAAGAEIRVATEVPTKLVVVPGYAAMVPLDFGTQTANNGLLVRDPVLACALASLFELVWDRAVPIPGVDPPHERSGAAGDRELLGLLAAGAKDETIARQLDVSLRTVRRRIAALLDDLGAQTRFQAGVLAVRRGWL